MRASSQSISRRSISVAPVLVSPIGCLGFPHPCRADHGRPATLGTRLPCPNRQPRVRAVMRCDFRSSNEIRWQAAGHDHPVARLLWSALNDDGLQTLASKIISIVSIFFHTFGSFHPRFLASSISSSSHNMPTPLTEYCCRPPLGKPSLNPHVSCVTSL